MILSAERIGPAISQVFETMYFREALYCGSATLKLPLLGTAVRFSGSVDGVFRWAVSERLAAQLAADFLGVETVGFDACELESAIKELANVACGSTLSAVMPSGDFHLSLPETLPIAAGEEEFRHSFSMEGAPPEIGFDIALTKPE